MDSYGGRDAAIGQYYTNYLKNGLVEEEFAIYGCVYLKENEPYLYITGKEKTFFSFQLDCEKKGYYCTPGIKRTFWSTVAKGERQNLKRSYQFQVMQELQTLYSEEFFKLINVFMDIPAKDDAKELIYYWEKQLDVCSNIAQLELFETTVSMLIQMKLLTASTGTVFLSRVEKLKQQFYEDESFQDGEPHTYAGFGCFKTGNKDEQMQFLMFDSYYNAWQKQQQLLAQQYMVSPIIAKTVYFHAVDFRIVKEYKNMFFHELQSLMGNEYFSLLKAIYQLPSIVSDKQYDRKNIQILKQLKENEKEALQQYAAKLRIY